MDRLPGGGSVARVGPDQAPHRNHRRVDRNPLSLPWLDLSIAASLVGSLVISLVRAPHRAFRGCLFFTGMSLICALLAWLGFALGAPDSPLNGITHGPLLRD